MLYLVENGPLSIFPLIDGPKNKTQDNKQTKKANNIRQKFNCRWIFLQQIISSKKLI